MNRMEALRAMLYGDKILDYNRQLIHWIDGKNMMVKGMSDHCVSVTAGKYAMSNDDGYQIYREPVTLDRWIALCADGYTYSYRNKPDSIPKEAIALIHIKQEVKPEEFV